MFFNGPVKFETKEREDRMSENLKETADQLRSDVEKAVGEIRSMVEKMGPTDSNIALLGYLHVTLCRVSSMVCGVRDELSERRVVLEREMGENKKR